MKRVLARVILTAFLLVVFSILALCIYFLVVNALEAPPSAWIGMGKLLLAVLLALGAVLWAADNA